MNQSEKNIYNLIKERVFWKYHNSPYHIQTSESGLHSNQYLNTDYIISDPTLVELIVKEIFTPELAKKNIKPDRIVTYPPFGLPIAYALAKSTWAKFAYIDPQTKTCNFNIQKDDIIVLVWDDIYSGGSIKATIKIMKDIGAKITSPICTIGNFMGTQDIEGIEILSAISDTGNLYEATECPMCKTWSKAVLPRPNRKQLTEL